MSSTETKPSVPHRPAQSDQRRLAHDLIDRLPEGELAAVTAFLRFTLDRVKR